MALMTKGAGKFTGLGHSLLWPSLFLLFCGWVITLGGLAALQNSCGSDNIVRLPAVEANLAGGVGCGKVYRWLWFIWAFEFAVFVGILITAAMGIAHPGPWLAWNPLLAIATVLQMIATNISYNLKDAYRGSGTSHTRANVTFAGFLITATANCLALIAIGLAVHHSYDKEDKEHGYVERRTAYTEPVPTGTTTTTTRTQEAETGTTGVARVV